MSFGTETAVAEAADIIARLHPDRVEIVEPNPLPRLIELIRKLGLPINPWLTAGGLGEAVTSLPDETPLLVPSKTAKAFAEARWPNRKVVLQDWPTHPLTLAPISGASQIACRRAVCAFAHILPLDAKIGRSSARAGTIQIDRHRRCNL